MKQKILSIILPLFLIGCSVKEEEQVVIKDSSNIQYKHGFNIDSTNKGFSLDKAKQNGN